MSLIKQGAALVGPRLVLEHYLLLLKQQNCDSPEPPSCVQSIQQQTALVKNKTTTTIKNQKPVQELRLAKMAPTALTIRGDNCVQAGLRAVSFALFPLASLPFFDLV